MKKIIQKGTMMITRYCLCCLQSTCVCSGMPMQRVANDAVYPIDSNSQAGPQAPNVSCETAVLMDANTGEILYNKGMDQLRYPASITKVMTCLSGFAEQYYGCPGYFYPNRSCRSGRRN